jgi:hypothetical protein
MEVVSSTPRPLYPLRKNTWYPLNRSLGGPQSTSRCSGEEKNFASDGNQTPAVQLVARRCTDWAITTNVPVVLDKIHILVHCYTQIEMILRSAFCLYLQGWSVSQTRKQQLLPISVGFLLDLLFSPDDRGGMFLRNVSWLAIDYMALYPRV